jgi:hypothetical protein
VSCEKDYGETRVGRRDAIAKLDPIDAVHFEVGHDDVHVTAAKGFQRTLRTVFDCRLVAARCELGFEELANALVVVDDEDSSTRSCRSHAD